MATIGEKLIEGEQPNDNSSFPKFNVQEVIPKVNFINNISDKRFKEMKETFELIKPEMQKLENLLKPYQLFEQDDLSNYCLELLNRRWNINAYPQRAYFIRKMYEYVLWEQGIEKPSDKLEQLFKVKLGFIMEVTIVIQYLHNQIIDGKFGVKNLTTIKRNLIASNILREILFQYIHQEIEGYGHVTLEKVKKCISNILLYVDLGQRIEQEYNHYDSYKQNLTLPICSSQIGLFTDLDCIRPIIDSIKKQVPNKGDFVEGYFRRIYLTNGCFHTFMTQLVMDILDYENNDLACFSIIYGIAMQITNDIIDYIPPIEENHKGVTSNTVGKKATDSYSDLRNFNITLPLIFHLSENRNKLIEKYLSKSISIKIMDKYYIEITNELKTTQSIDEARYFAKDLISHSKPYLNLNNDHSAYLFNMIEKAEWNKYYHSFYKQ